MPLVWDALLHASPASRRRPGSRCWSLSGKASSTRFHAPKLPPARGGEREWSCLSLHRVVVLALFPRLLPPNANVPHSPSHAKGRESGHASPCISQTTRPWSIGNRITRWAPERGAREAAANGPRGLAPSQSPLTLPRVCCSPPHRTRAFGSPELSLRDQSHPRPLTASKNSYPVCCCGTKPHSPPHAARRESGHASPYISQVRPASSAATLQVGTRAHISPGVVIAAATRVRDSRAAPRPTE